MTVPILTFFNNKGGVGKTSLLYHLAWMYADLGLNVIAADLDPQSKLAIMFLDEDRLESLWGEDGQRKTIYGALRPLLEGAGDIASPHIENLTDRLALVVGDIALSSAEDELSGQWSACLDRQPRAFRVISAIWRILQNAANERDAEMILVDVGPNLGALNRAALVAADYVVVPLAADLYSLQGLRNLGPTLQDWRDGWEERRPRNPVPAINVPDGGMRPIGYVVQQHGVRLGRPVKAYDKWVNRMPAEYAENVLRVRDNTPIRSPNMDDNCLATVKHYRSLVPLAQEARKPIFKLTAADGAVGGHASAARAASDDFGNLAKRIAERIPEIDL